MMKSPNPDPPGRHSARTKTAAASGTDIIAHLNAPANFTTPLTSQHPDKPPLRLIKVFKKVQRMV